MELINFEDDSEKGIIVSQARKVASATDLRHRHLKNQITDSEKAAAKKTIWSLICLSLSA